jgi:hypothetical protein
MRRNSTLVKKELFSRAEGENQPGVHGKLNPEFPVTVFVAILLKTSFSITKGIVLYCGFPRAHVGTCYCESELGFSIQGPGMPWLFR